MILEKVAKKNWLPSFLLFISTLGLGLILTNSVIYRLRFWHFSAYDMGLHLHGIWKIAFSESSFNTIRGMEYLGDHVWGISYLLALILKATNSLQIFVFFYFILFLSSLFAIYSIAQYFKISRNYSIVIAISWLLQPAVWNLFLEGLYPENLATPFLLWNLLFIMRGQTSKAFFFGLLAAICKEDIAITLAFVSVLYAVKTKNKTHLLLTVFWGIFFAINLKIIMPQLNGIGFFRFNHGYWFSGLLTNLTRLNFYQEAFFNPTVFNYLLGLFGPFLFLPIRSFWTLGFLPSFAVNCLSRTDYLRSVFFHYNNQTTPFIIVGFLDSFSKLKNEIAKKILLILCLVISFTLNIKFCHNNVANCYDQFLANLKNVKTEKQIEFEKIVNKYLSSSDTSISANYNLVPSLSFREQIFMYPNPFQRYYFGINEDIPMPKFSDPDFIILDKDFYARENKFPLPPNYSEIEKFNGFLLLKKTSERNH